MTGDEQRWNQRYRSRGLADRPPAQVLDALLLPALDQLCPQRGAALDVAGGDGRNALWLARHGFQVTVADVSSQGLDLARQRLSDQGQSLRTIQADLDGPLPASLHGPWALVLCCNYLNRTLLGSVATMLSPGGCLVVSHPTRQNLQRHAHPSSRFLLEEGELAGLAAGLTVWHHSEAWRPDGRHLAWLVARR